MTLIKQSKPVCTVVVTIDAAAEIMPELEEHAAAGLKLFAELNGFVSGALHKSSDGARLIQYLQWSSMADHQACMNDPQWEHLPSTRKFSHRSALSQPHRNQFVPGMVWK